LHRRVPSNGPPICFLGLNRKKLNREESREEARRHLVILRKPVAGLSQAALAKFVLRASDAVKLKGTVNILVTRSSELRRLNRRFRGKDKPTDVLSFPPNPDFADGLAGDIAISADIAKRSARHLGHSAAQEIRILALHGVLHLAGYDHERDIGRMALTEANLRRTLGLPDGLIERNGRSRSRTSKRKGQEKRAKDAGEGARATPGRATPDRATQARTAVRRR
jgi:probable rRNA maturation factor